MNRAGSIYTNVSSTGIKKLILPNSYVLTTALPSNYLNKGSNLAVGLYSYNGINEIGVNSDNPNYKTIDGILYSKDGTIMWYVPTAKTGNIPIPTGVTTIKSGTFYGTTTSRNITVSVPATVTNIESTELTELMDLGPSKVTFDSNCVYHFDTSGNIVKS